MNRRGLGCSVKSSLAMRGFALPIANPSAAEAPPSKTRGPGWGIYRDQLRVSCL
jgi:hypothetical protein